MRMLTAYEEATEAFQIPRIIRLGPNLFGASFGLMKMVPARYILRKAMREGLLDPHTVVVETTSGTFGLALAMQTVHLDRRLILVSDPVIDERLYRRLTDLGAVVERVQAKPGMTTGGYQTARLERLAQIREEHVSTFCPEQYSNPDNPLSYGSVAELLADALGRVDCLVGPVGSGGSMCGTTTFLREQWPHCQAIAVDTHGSVVFGQTDGIRELRGLGMSLLPGNVDHTVFDSVHWCTAACAYAATRRLHQKHALYQGPTSGAAYLVAEWWARANPDAVTVVMLPDEGHRYQDTVYDDEWLMAEGHLAAEVPAEPVQVGYPDEEAGAWTWYDWGRRSYPEVMSSVSTGVG
jgi:cysteine synthase